VFVYAKVLDIPLGEIGTVQKSWKEKDLTLQTPVSLPFALARKYPKADMSLDWRWLFTSQTRRLPNLPALLCHRVVKAR
jgi:hypothetical protein